MTKETADKNIEELSALLYDICNNILEFERICDTLLPLTGQSEIVKAQEDRVNHIRQELIETLCDTFNLKKEN